MITWCDAKVAATRLRSFLQANPTQVPRFTALGQVPAHYAEATAARQAPSWSSFFNAAGRNNEDIAFRTPHYQPLFGQLPANLRPTRLLGSGAESTAVLARGPGNTQQVVKFQVGDRRYPHGPDRPFDLPTQSLVESPLHGNQVSRAVVQPHASTPFASPDDAYYANRRMGLQLQRQGYDPYDLLQNRSAQTGFVPQPGGGLRHVLIDRGAVEGGLPSATPSPRLPVAPPPASTPRPPVSLPTPSQPGGLQGLWRSLFGGR